MSRKRPFQDVTNSHDERTFVLDCHTVKKANLAKQPADKQPPAAAATKDAANRMQVYVRVRPQNERELGNTNLKRILHLANDKDMIFDPREDGLNTYFYQGKLFKEVGKKPNKNLEFNFDQVFNEYATNRNVFNVTTKDLINPLLEGCNCTVFAYGATGSGKTHTIIGNEREPGVIYLTVMELFKKIKNCNDLEISISYLEIYNEHVYDLLAPTTGKSLAVREDSKRGVVVANLSVHYPEDANHLINMIKVGNNNRAKQATNANSQSSRSHAIFQIYIEKHDYSSPHTMSIQLSKMSLIDLAGSERAAVAYKGKRSQSLQREGSNINKSLLSLGNCINALVMKQKLKSTHIPYRNSKLTLLLRDSLNGNSKTVMIAAISPTSLCYEDTHNTLTYASRAMGIQFNYKPSTLTIDSRANGTVDSLRQENERLKNEIERLKRDLVDARENKNCLPFTKKLELTSYLDKRCEMRKSYIEYDNSLKRLIVKKRLLSMNYDRLVRMHEEEGYDRPPVLDLKPLDDKLAYFQHLKEETEKQLKKSQELIDECCEVIKTKISDNAILDEFLQRKVLEGELKEKELIEQHLLEMNTELLKKFEEFLTAT